MSIEVDEDVETGVDPIFDKGIEFAGALHFGELLHYKVLLVGGHMFAGEIEGAAGGVGRQSIFITHFERVGVCLI